MTLQRALILTKAGSATDHFELTQVEKSKPEPNQILVHVRAIALNPVDWKMAKYGFLIKSYPVVLGCDVAGVVEEIGSEVTDFKVGDEVFGLSSIGVSGAFQEFTLLESDLAAKKPTNISFEQAATLPVGALTACLQVFHYFGFPTPGKQPGSMKGKPILIWGGATSCGAYAIQMANLAGFKVIATASPASADYVKSLGAHHVVDYRDPDAVNKIKAIGGDSLNHAIDCVSAETAKLAVDSLAPGHNGFITCIAGEPKNVPSNVKVQGVLLATVYGNPNERKFVSDTQRELSQLIQDGKVAPNLVQKVDGGLNGVKEGLQLLAGNKISGKKVVVVVSETH